MKLEPGPCGGIERDRQLDPLDAPLDAIERISRQALIRCSGDADTGSDQPDHDHPGKGEPRRRPRQPGEWIAPLGQPALSCKSEHAIARPQAKRGVRRGRAQITEVDREAQHTDQVITLGGVVAQNLLKVAPFFDRRQALFEGSAQLRHDAPPLLPAPAGTCTGWPAPGAASSGSSPAADSAGSNRPFSETPAR